MLPRVLSRMSSLAPSSTAQTSSAATRAFSTTHRVNRTPALADVPPDNSAQFDARQKDFRDHQAQQKQQREHQESQSASQAKQSSSPSSSSSVSSSSPGSDPIVGVSSVSHDGSGLGSYSTSSAGDKQQDADGSGKKKAGSGRLSSLIYGTEEGRQMDREIERSFSQVLARGKYVHSIVFHDVKPDKVDEYVDLVGSWYPRMAGMPENKVCDTPAPRESGGHSANQA